jgi:hypothetical protein
MIVSHIHRSKTLHGVKKIYFWEQKFKNKPSEPKNRFGAQNQYVCVIYPSIGNYIWSKKKYTSGGQKGKNKPSKLKKEFGAQNQYVRVIYPLIGNFK